MSRLRDEMTGGKHLLKVIEQLKSYVKHRLIRVEKTHIIYILLFGFYVVLMPRTGHDWDTTCWREWAKHIFSHGLSKAYQSGTDYMPFYQYVLFFFGKAQGSIENIQNNIHQLKILTLLFDFAGGFFLIRMIKDEKAGKPNYHA